MSGECSVTVRSKPGGFQKAFGEECIPGLATQSLYQLISQIEAPVAVQPLVRESKTASKYETILKVSLRRSSTPAYSWSHIMFFGANPV